jgi:hypothetical protein
MRTAKNRKYFPSVSFDGPVIRVFDLKNDPAERKNLAAKMPAEAEALLEKLQAFVGESERLSPSRYVGR